jgi:hypothetical protein
VVDRVLANEFKGVITIIFFEDSDCTFGKRNTEALGLRVVKLDLAWDHDIVLTVPSNAD